MSPKIALCSVWSPSFRPVSSLAKFGGLSYDRRNVRLRLRKKRRVLRYTRQALLAKPISWPAQGRRLYARID